MPFDRNEKNLFHYFDKMEKEFFRNFEHDFSQFRTDILDRGNHYELQAELPGFEKNEIDINICDNYLTITAQHKQNKEETKDSFVCRERKYGSYSRSFDISGIKLQEISASYKHGVLSVILPKAEQKKLEQGHHIQIQ